MVSALRVCCLAVCACLAIALPAAAGELIHRRFDPAALAEPERRLLQVALAAAGDFAGPLDGRWDAASSAAIEAWSAREMPGPPANLHAATLVIELMAEIETEGWVLQHLPDLGLSLALPEATLEAPELEDGGTRWWSRTGTLTLLTHRFDGDFAQAWHRAAALANAAPAALETVRAADRLVTAGRLGDGRAFYTRSDRVGGHWATVYLASGTDEADKLNLIRASIAAGAPAGWELPEGGLLETVIRDTLDLFGEPGEASAAGTAALPALPAEASGTGFYVNRHVLVTASHVVAGCGRVGLPDGTELTLLAHDSDLDIAALMAPEPSRSWLSFSPGDRARLGEKVHALGFPYYSIAGTSLHLTGGNVSSLADVNDDDRFFSFSAPVQPGNSGGPLLDAQGNVMGLVVARLSERFIAEATGTLPQNINYALNELELARFLDRHGIEVPAGGLPGFDMDEGAPDGVAAAIVPVLCRG
jgi:serine protease Do